MTKSALHDFDFFVGRWRVHHRQLKQRLADCREWSTFSGTTATQLLMDGRGNMDDNVLDLPSGPYRAVTLRAFDVKTQQWSIWWLDGREPSSPLDPPMRGGFKEGVGTFYAEDAFNGKPIRVRFIWSRITTVSCQWEQAYSPDQGENWETNWIMSFQRA
jgi:hypothetical protein